MDGSTKILTVSYGTFSCTLEGFDDPLGAMRDIAEYFRDLAADDRYFGAEPLTPDVEMLQNIAERDVTRRVEARRSDTGVALRQVERHNTDEPAPSPKAERKVADTPDVVDAAKDAPKDKAAIAASVVTAVKATDVVDKPATSDAGTGPLTFDDEFLMSDEPEDVLAVDPDARVVDASPAETVAEKLRRIRSVVSKNIEDKVEAAASDDIEDAEVIDTEKRDRAFTETIEQISADIADDDIEVSKEKRAEKTTEAVSAPKPDLSGKSDQPDAKEDDFDGDQDDDSARIDSAARDTSEALWTRDADSEAAASDADLLRNDTENDEGEFSDVKADTAEDEDFDPEKSESLFLTSDDQVDAEQNETVIDAVLEHAAGEPDLDSIAKKIAAADDKAVDNTARATDAAPARSDAAIKRTISDIIGNMGERLATDDSAEAHDHEVADVGAPTRALSQPLSDAQESDVGRLLEETDNKLNEDEVVRRRRVISQMRAAVAATKADRLVSRQVSREVVEEEERSPYRDDLSEVVRTATVEGAGIDRPTSASPPLVLVSSQRVKDESAASDTSDVMDEPQNFAGFAEIMGAKELPELLEAAAAFTVFKEGQSSFTRPEIMKRVAAVDPTIRMSREESLRSFGQLLRQGKFRKLERGQFTIDKGTQYNPTRRFAGE